VVRFRVQGFEEFKAARSRFNVQGFNVQGLEIVPRPLIFTHVKVSIYVSEF